METTRHCLLREDKFPMRRWQELVKVSRKELQESGVGNFDETGTNHEPEVNRLNSGQGHSVY